MRQIARTALIMFLSAHMLVGQKTRSQGELNNAQLASQIDQYLKPYLDIGGFTGSILIAKDGKVILAKSYGMSNYELNTPNTPQTVFHICSVSKIFTAAAIMLLQEQGKLKVDDPLTRFIPDYPNGERIKLHHLLTNTSGIPNINNFPDYADFSRFPHTPADLIEYFKNKPLDFEPGSRGYIESNSNYNLLAYIIEKVSGQSYGDFIRDHLIVPAGLLSSAHDGDASALVPNKASGYFPAGINGESNAPYLDWSTKTGNGSMYSTVEDLERWNQALDDQRVLKKDSAEQMFKNEYGWFNTTFLGRHTLRMNGRSPGFNAEIGRYPDDHVFIAVLENTYVPTAGLVAKDVARMVFRQPYEVPKINKPMKLDGKALATLAGHYKFGGDFFVPNGLYEVESAKGELWLRYPGSDTVLTPQSPTDFFVRAFWSNVVFADFKDGVATHLIWKFGGSDYVAQRVP